MIFTYSRSDGETIDVIVKQGKTAPRRVRRDGKTYRKDIIAGSSIQSGKGGWPIWSDAMAVHPSQIEEARERARAHGVRTEFSASGKPCFRSPAHRRKHMAVFGMRDLAGFD